MCLPPIAPSNNPPINGEMADKKFAIVLSHARYIGRSFSGDSSKVIFSVVMLWVELNPLTEWTNPNHNIAQKVLAPDVKIHKAGNIDLPIQAIVSIVRLPYLSARDPHHLERAMLDISPIAV